MKTPLAIYNLWHQGAKTFVSIGGVAFALLLVFMQLGFKGAVSHTATNVLNSLEFDILLRSHEYMHLYESGRIDRNWLEVAKGARGVEDVQPFWITIQNWKTLPSQAQMELETNPRPEPGNWFSKSWNTWFGTKEYEAQYLPIAVMAYRTQDSVFTLPDVDEQESLLFDSTKLLIDDGSHDDYGPWGGVRFTNEGDIGRQVDIYQRPFEIAGTYRLGTGLAANGAVIMGEQAFARIWPGLSTANFSSLALIKVSESSPQAVAEAIEAIRERLMHSSGSADSQHAELNDEHNGFLSTAWATVKTWLGIMPELPMDGVVQVLSKEEARDREVHRWLWQTPIGLIFQLGVMLALIVGAAIVYMILSTDVANRLPEYATLLAMGYSRNYLAGIVMTQAVILCIFGFCAAWGVAEILYRITYWLSNLPLEMNLTRVFSVLILGLVMSCLSGMLALRKLWKAEPASLF